MGWGWGGGASPGSMTSSAPAAAASATFFFARSRLASLSSLTESWMHASLIGGGVGAAAAALARRDATAPKATPAPDDTASAAAERRRAGEAARHMRPSDRGRTPGQHQQHPTLTLRCSAAKAESWSGAIVASRDALR